MPLLGKALLGAVALACGAAGIALARQQESGPEGTASRADECARAEAFLSSTIRSLDALAQRNLAGWVGRERTVGSGFEIETRALLESDVRGWTKRGLEALRAELDALGAAGDASGPRGEPDARRAAWRAQSRGVSLAWNAHMDVTRACLAVLQHESSRDWGTRSERWREIEDVEGEAASAMRARFRAEEATLRARILDDLDVEYERLRGLRLDFVASLWRLEQAARAAGEADLQRSLAVQRFELFDLEAGYAVVPTMRLDVVHGLTSDDLASHPWLRTEVGRVDLSLRSLYEPDVQALVADLSDVPLPRVVDLRVVERVDGRFLPPRAPLAHERPFYVELEFAGDARAERLEVELESSLERRRVVVERVSPRLYRSAVLFLEAAAEVR